MKYFNWVGLTLWATLVVCSTADARVFSVDRVVREASPETTARRFEGPQAVVGHVPARRNILGLERAHPFALPTAASAAQLKTLNVAVLRVQFRQELPDDPSTTGDGHFDLRDSLTFFAEEGHQFEQAPHNREFFEAVMRAMAQYYDVVSNGRLTVLYEVFPHDRDSAYTVDSSMAWYGGRNPNEGIADLLTDAVIKADTDPDLVFADYDAYILFHAGSDRQHDFSPLTPTPNDLFTGYLRLLEPGLFIPVDGGAKLIEDAVLLPETATQDNRGSGLGGSVAHEFGHQLGLVDLYSTRTGTTQVGDFSLMDSDAQSLGIFLNDTWTPGVFFDLMPTYMDAWSRAFLGFVDPTVVWPDSILAHAHPDPDSVRPWILRTAEEQQPFGQIIKVPITNKEYYLLEFRSPDHDLNAEPDWDPFGVGIRADSFFNVILGPTLCGDPRIADSCREFGRDYDFQLPVTTGGMLIWHVDEEVGFQLVPEFEGEPYLTSNFVANTLQWDRHRRFLEIEEADGLIDFGGVYFTGFGSQKELWLGGYRSEFGPATNPSTRSHTGAPSHLRIYDISPIYPPNASPDLLPFHHMQLKISSARAAAGWPRATGHTPAPQLTVIRGGGGDTVLATAGRYVLAWTDAGDPLLTQQPGDLALAFLQKLDGTLDTLELAGFARADTTLATQPSVGTDSTAGTRTVAAVDIVGSVYLWSFADGDADGWADLTDTLVFPFDLGTEAPQPALWFDADGDRDEEMFVTGGGGSGIWWEDASATPFSLGVDTVRDWALVMPQAQVYVAADQGIVRALPLASPLAVSLGLRLESICAVDDDRDGADVLFGHDSDQLYRLDLDPAPQIDRQRDPGFDLSGPLTSGDHDEDGRPSLFCAAGEWEAGFQPALFLERNFPLRSDDVYPGAPLTEALTLNGETIFGGADGEVQGYTADGEFAPGWPFFAGDTIVSLATVQSEGDSLILLARSTNGYTWGTRAAGDPDPAGAWTQSRGNAQKQNRWNPAGATSPNPVTALLPEETVFAYPNPAPRGPVRIRYYLGTASEVDVRVYDLAGNEVAAGTGSGEAGNDNEWIWNAATVAPGVYFCRVRARAGGSEVVEICKVAITP